jgi:hypothetical protein
MMIVDFKSGTLTADATVPVRKVTEAFVTEF